MTIRHAALAAALSMSVAAAFAAPASDTRPLAPVNAVVRRMNEPYVTTLGGMHQPWRYLVDYVPDLCIRPALWGAAYSASGRYARPESVTT